MSIVTSKEIARVLGADKLGHLGTFIGWNVLKLLRISRINEVYIKNKDRKGISFLNGVLDELDITFEIPEDDLNRIPSTGSFITISNHPLGGIDGILLLKLLLEKRADYKILGLSSKIDMCYL